MEEEELLVPQDRNTYTNITTLKDEFHARQQYLRKACVNEGRTPPTSIANSNLTDTMIIEVTHNILYCPVQKVGSSFWMKTLAAIKSQGRFSSPYEVKMNKQIAPELYRHFRKTPRKYLNSFLQNAVSLLVVREPYSKLFSGYVDKLYNPNYLFWKILGNPIKRIIQNKSDGELCGNDISFSDYIKYIIYETYRNDGKLNPHFTPIYKHCDPCTTKYDYIMKFENFKEDYYYIIEEWTKMFDLQISFQDYEIETTLDIAEKHIRLSFSTMLKYSKKCNIPEHNFILRTWRFLQISGLIPKDADLPFIDDENALPVTKEKLLQAVADTLSNDIDWVRVKEQRHEALTQAYQSVDIADLMKLREIVKPDCMYFDYDDTPNDLFKRNNELFFNYFDGLV